MTDTIFMTLVRNKMGHLKINSKQLAEMIDMNHAALNMILTERVRTTLGVSLKLAQVLEIELDPLIKLSKKNQSLN